MAEANKKYVANVDFPPAKEEEGHKIHLNPYFEDSGLKEEILRHYDPEQSKIPRDGGAVYLTRAEALECLRGVRQVKWQRKTAFPFKPCELCDRLAEWDLGSKKGIIDRILDKLAEWDIRSRGESFHSS